MKDLVLVGPEDRTELPSAALRYPGQVYCLLGGFAAWQRFVLDEPEPLPDGAGEQQIAQYRFRAAVHSAFTGSAAPPPPKPTKFQAPPPRKAGGCS